MMEIVNLIVSTSLAIALICIAYAIYQVIDVIREERQYAQWRRELYTPVHTTQQDDVTNVN